MAVKRTKSARAVTLVEIMVAMAVLAIAALGTVGYQYHAAWLTSDDDQTVNLTTAILPPNVCPGQVR